ncbi:probable GPI-anchored adhesin-like protein PGA55 [Contarinia nasturtii]|uniref:probable GPI-anchored adhesin-like protein PGA55 n=1 Tax=Contarinia nasturtii TaxID=265458 RepID=UPI0012D3F646|nr:probable GPI-anchored adhesin-like protein PGA55 [Contarinia nasturtii]
MSSAFETLLEAARFIELQEQRERLTSTSSTASSLSTSPHSNSRYHYQSNYASHQSLVTTPPASPLSDIPRSHIDYISSNGTTITRNEEPFPQQRDDINAEQAIKLSNSSECILSRKSDRFQLHQPYPMLMQRDRLSYNKPMPSQHDCHLVKSKSLSPLESHAQQRPKANYFVSDAMHIARSRSTSLTLKPFTTSNYAIKTGEDSSQSSLNLSASSGYLSGSSANSSNLNLSGRSSSSSMNGSTHHISNGNGVLTIHSNGNHVNGDQTTNNHVFYEKSPIINGYVDKRNGNSSSNGTHHLQQSPPQAVQQQTLTPQATNSRRRTISSNSNGGTQRSASIHRAGTREVHNKLEKNRRAHLKECFEQLKRQLPQMQEEKKTSNLLILSNASKYISQLKRKEKEFEHEMERLAKEKIAKQEKLEVLRHQMSTRFDNMHSTIQLPDNESNGIRERVPSESLSEQSLPSRVRYGSTSSLSSAATASSPCAAGVPSQSASTISPVITTTSTILNASSSSPSPKRAHSSSPISASTVNMHSAITEKYVKFVDSPKILPNGLTAISNGLKAHNPPIAINLSTSDGISPALLNASNAAAAMPLNLVHQPITNGISTNQSIRTITAANSNGLQIISSTPSVTNGKNGIRHQDHHNSKEQIKKIETISTSSEPPTKVIKLINGNGITLASVDKETKLIPSTQLTLSQVVVSQIPLLAPTQTLRVIGAPNGVATIELSNSNAIKGRTPVQNQQHSLPNGTNGAHLHKFLVSGASTNLTAPVITSTFVNGTMTNGTSELARLPGGAELNAILPPNTNGTTLYRSNGQLAIIKGAETNQSNRAVHMVTPLQQTTTTPIVISSQGQSSNNIAHHIIASNLSFT